MEDPPTRRSVGARIGLVMLAGAAVILVGLLILIFDTTTAGVTVMILGALTIIAAPLPVVLAEAPGKPKPGERPPVKYGSNDLGWALREIDPTWDRRPSSDEHEPPARRGG